jgi:hypothetical protein
MSDPVIPTADQADMMKKVLFDTFMSQYRQMTDFINRLPVSLAMKQIIIKHFDDGFLWTKEAFTLIQFVPPAAPEVPASEPDVNLVEETPAAA